MLTKCFFPGFMVQESSRDHGSVVMLKYFQYLVVNLHHVKTVKVRLTCEDKEFSAFQFLSQFFKVPVPHLRFGVKMDGE
ncbi:hypothetical protein ES708_27873 [subsurface metagenome]